jgi:DNA-nicking Smr family endonuclease
MNEIDLHGLPHSKALEITEDFVLSESVVEVFQCRIITGKSMKLQTKIIDEVLKPYNFKWYIPAWNTGEIIVMEGLV